MSSGPHSMGHPMNAKHIHTPVMTRVAIAILALTAFPLWAEERTPATSSSGYTGLNETAVFSITRWDRDGDNLLEWTDNLMRQSGLSTEDASELVLLQTGCLTLLGPDDIASEGGRTKMYKDWVTRDLNLVTSGAWSNNPRWRKYAPSSMQSKEVDAATPPKFLYKPKYNRDTSSAELIAAAESNDPEALYRLGNLHLRKNTDVPFDEAKGLGLILKSAELGFAPAQTSLGQFYMHNYHDFGSKPETAVQWWQKAADQGYPEALWSLASAYNGTLKGVQEDPKKAVALLTSAAEQGYRLAQVDLAQIYSNGRGVERDFAKAFELYLQAAEQGDDDAQLKVAECYEQGIGVARDPEQAAKWSAKAEETKGKRP